MSVFYLKYRPSLFSELDSVQAADNLKKILAAKDLPQSFLFAGPKGSGKTSAARILAKLVNCEEVRKGEPCGKCDSCRLISEGKSMDIIEIDAASNRGIEDIRDLKDKAYLMPSKLKRKVFIIDEVHMLTKDAFNALLKLIEEPPEHSIFVLCTTDPEKIPETVLSRLLRVDFKRGSKSELKKSLERVILGEKLKVDDRALELIIDKSDGSFRNIQRVLNEIYLNIGEKISFEAVDEFFRNIGGEYSESDFEKDLLAGDIRVILEKIERMAEKGVDFKDFNERLLIYFQSKLLLNFGVGEGNKSAFSITDVERLITLLIRAIKQGKDVEIEQLPLELVVVDFLSLGSDREKKEKNKEIDVERSKVKEKGNKVQAKTAVVVDKEQNSVALKGLKIDLDRVKCNWGNLLMAVKPFNHSVEAFLRATQPKLIKNDCLVVEVFYPFHKDRLEENKNRQIVEDGLKKILGVDMRFECVLAKDRKKPLVINNTTPIENVSTELVDGQKDNKKDLYDVAKDIFG